MNALKGASRLLRGRASGVGSLSSTARSGVSSLPPLVKCSEEVANALREGTPVVALESTIISHGMPYPDNLNTAVEVENVVREHGAVPATIALMDGFLHVGLERPLLERLAKDGKSAIKCSRRDISLALARKSLGATTVSGTMIAADIAGIDVFVTGGVGGVHRGVEATMDVSADLAELGKTPVVVVCAGVKSILDIPRTLEYLETQGVAVMCWKTDRFPAFFTLDSGEAAPNRVDSASDVADWINVNGKLGMRTGAVVAVPNPDPADRETIDKALETALREVSEKEIGGKEATPYLLQRMNELTGGESLRSNIALVRNNAAVGAKIAVAASRNKHHRRSFATSARPLVVGGSTMDVVSTSSGALTIGTSNIGVVTHSHGGAGRNVCEAMGRLAARPLFISVLGDDDAGSAIIDGLAGANVDASGVIISRGRTAVYNAVLDGDGDLVAAIADMDIMEKMKLEGLATALNNVKTKPSLIILDGNLDSDALALACHHWKDENARVWFEPTSVAKSTRVTREDVLPLVELISPNVDELRAIWRVMPGSENDSDSCDDFDIAKQVAERMSLVASGAQRYVVVTMGDEGAMVAEAGGGSSSVVKVPPPQGKVKDMENCTGAGDTLLGTAAAAVLRCPELSVAEAVEVGMHAASLTIKSSRSVSEHLDEAWLDEALCADN